MQVRRCAVVWLEPREVASFQLDDLLAGGTGVVARLCWFAHAPHLGAAVEVDADWVPLLGALGAQDWLVMLMLKSINARVSMTDLPAMNLDCFIKNLLVMKV